MATGCNNILDDLDEYQEIQVQTENGGAIISAEGEDGRVYLSDAPGLWSAFASRAFVFKSLDDAQSFIDTHQLELYNATAEERPL